LAGSKKIGRNVEVLFKSRFAIKECESDGLNNRRLPMTVQSGNAIDSGQEIDFCPAVGRALTVRFNVLEAKRFNNHVRFKSTGSALRLVTIQSMSALAPICSANSAGRRLTRTASLIS